MTINDDGTSAPATEEPRREETFSPVFRIAPAFRAPEPVLAKRWRRLRGGERCERPSARDPELAVTRFRFPAPHPGAAGRRIAFVSDLHYRADRYPEFRIEALLDELRTFSPDLLLFGGDMVRDAATMEEIPPLLARFAALAPACCAVTGNWEQGKTWIPKAEWRAFFRSGGVELLLNDFFRLPWLDLYGSEDPSRGDPAWPAGDGWRADTLRVFFTHRPDTAILAEGRGSGFHLAFAGHTHAGQWRLPLVGALLTHSLYGRRFDAGGFESPASGARLIVGRGLGEGSLPWRFRCRREVVLTEFAAGGEGAGS